MIIRRATWISAAAAAALLAGCSNGAMTPTGANPDDQSQNSHTQAMPAPGGASGSSNGNAGSNPTGDSTGHGSPASSTGSGQTGSGAGGSSGSGGSGSGGSSGH